MTTPAVGSFSIIGYFNLVAPPQLAGTISGMLYFYEGLTNWTQLGATPPTVPKGTALNLAVQWLNQSTEAISGHIELTITEPEGSKVTLKDVLNQDNWATPGKGSAVYFEPITLDQAGIYKAEATLSTMGQVLQKMTFNVAAPAVAKFYMNSFIDFTVQDGSLMGMYWHYHFSNTIINKGTGAGTYDITHEIIVNGVELFERVKTTISLGPGETHEWWREIDIDWRRVAYVKVSLSGNWEKDNYSEVTVCKP